MAEVNSITKSHMLDVGIWSRAETWAGRSVPVLISLGLLAALLIVSQTIPEVTYNFADYVKADLTKMGADPSAQVIDFGMLGEAKAAVAGGSPTFPAALTALDGKPVAIIGFMAPYDQIDDMTHCMIMPAYVGCYFCKPPSLSQVVFARQKDRSAVKKAYIDDPVLVSGKLMLYKKGSDHPGHLSQFLYVIEDASVRAYAGPAAPKRAAPVHAPGTPAPTNTPNRLNRPPVLPGQPAPVAPSPAPVAPPVAK